MKEEFFLQVIQGNPYTAIQEDDDLNPVENFSFFTFHN
jgi:hypothetical protein